MIRSGHTIQSDRWWRNSRYIYFVLSTIWVFFLLFGVASTWLQPSKRVYESGQPVPIVLVQPVWERIAATVLVSTFIVVYVTMMYLLYYGDSWGEGRLHTSNRPWFVRLSLTVIATLLALLPHESEFRRWSVVFVFVVMAWVLGADPAKAFSSVFVATGVSFLILTVTYDVVVAIGVAFPAFAAGFMVSGYVINRGVINELRLERSRVRDQAITEERFRLARDLHDTVGHSMTQITLKAHLARKLLVTDVERAANELTDIEQLSRSLSAEIRRSIAGDVTPTVAIELARAEELLGAVDIHLDHQVDATGLTENLDTLFGWAVREGVLNIIKHSQATRCEISLERDGETAKMSIRDNGRTSPAEVVPGQGLMGLRQRAEEQGGSVHWRQTDTGFVLEVRIPAA